MTIEEAMTILDGVLGQATLTDTQELVFRHAWEDWTYDRMADQFGYTTDHIKNVGAHLWDLLSNLLGTKVTKKNLQAVLRRWAQQYSVPAKVSEPRNPHQDWGEAPDSASFTGRAAELLLLDGWIRQERCRLVALLGMGGIGKTSLAAKLARQVQSQFDRVIWRSLQHAPTLSELLANLIQFLANEQDLEVALPPDLDGRVLRLIGYLRQYRCLLILDNAESVLPCHPLSQDSQSSTNGYSELLERLSELPHQSCVILTSREKPDAIAWKEGDNLPVRSLPLSGLNDTDGRQIFALKGTFQASATEWQQLIHHYAGNPLALKMVAAAIQELFGGNISEFLSVLGTFVFDDISNLLSCQFNRLSAVEKEVMYWLAINREVTCFTELRDDVLSPISKQKLPATLRSLKHRFFIETNANGFTQQPVVMEYVTEQLIERVCEEIQSFDAHRDPASFSLLHTHALLKANAKDYIREYQTQLFMESIASRLLTVRQSPKDIERCCNYLLSVLRSQPRRTLGYAAGNVLNLLCHLNVDLTDFDFSNLTIAQAYLQGVDLHGVNFSHSNLSRSVFNESLGNVWSVAFSPDGQFLAVSDSNGEIHLWRIADYKKVLTFRGHHNWICSVAFSPAGNYLASSSADSTLKLWEITTGKCLRTLQGHSDWIVAVAFSADGTLLASSGVDSESVRLWSVKTGKCLRTLDGHTHWVCAIAFHPHQALLASGSDDYTIKVWNIRTGDCLQTLLGHTNHVRSVAYSPDGRWLASSSDDHSLKLWDTTTGECLQTLHGHTSNVRSVVFDPDGQTLISASEDRTVKLWNWQTGQCVKTLHGHTAHVRTVAIAPRSGCFSDLSEDSSPGRLIASGGADHTVRLWDSHTGRCLKTLQGYASFVLGVAFAPPTATQGQDSHRGLLASSSADHTVKLWDIQTRQCLKILQGHNHWVWSVAFSPDGKTLASTSFDHTIRLWDVDTGRCQKVLHRHTHWVWSAVFSPDGKTLASGASDHLICLWDVHTGHCFQTIDCQANHVLSVAFSPSHPNLIASANDDCTITLWDISTGDRIHSLHGHTSRATAIAFTPNGEWLISGSADHTIKVWEMATGQCLKTLTGHTAPVECIALRAVLPAVSATTAAGVDADLVLFSSSDDRTVKCWSLTTGDCIQTLEGHTRRVWAIAASPDGAVIASGSEDETVRLWNPTTGESTLLRSPRPYEAMNITGATGLTPAQVSTLKALGAIERPDERSLSEQPAYPSADFPPRQATG